MIGYSTARRRLLRALAGALFLPALAMPALAKPRSILIFFDREQATLPSSGPAQQLVAMVHKAINRGARVTLEGYCDGSEDNPDRLSAARAAAVLGALVALGPPRGVTFTVAGKGVAKPRGTTKPKAASPYSRYVLVTIE
jgi:outer membrane protein OmpA-like peptidoglycan-associated protein